MDYIFYNSISDTSFSFMLPLHNAVVNIMIVREERFNLVVQLLNSSWYSLRYVDLTNLVDAVNNYCVVSTNTMYSCRKIVTTVTITKKIGGSCVTSNFSGKGYLGKYEIQFGSMIGY